MHIILAIVVYILFVMWIFWRLSKTHKCSCAYRRNNWECPSCDLRLYDDIH